MNISSKVILYLLILYMSIINIFGLCSRTLQIEKIKLDRLDLGGNEYIDKMTLQFKIWFLISFHIYSSIPKYTNIYVSIFFLNF
jgi:hypothetical protein